MAKMGQRNMEGTGFRSLCSRAVSDPRVARHLKKSSPKTTKRRKKREKKLNRRKKKRKKEGTFRRIGREEGRRILHLLLASGGSSFLRPRRHGYGSSNQDVTESDGRERSEIAGEKD